MDISVKYGNEQEPGGFDKEIITPPLLNRSKWRIQSIALDLSGNCNLSCRYCAEHAKQPARTSMIPEILYAALQLLYPDGVKDCNTSIRLGSGEPFRSFETIKKIDKWISAIDKTNKSFRLDVFITSNGTLIDEEVINFLKKKNWYLKISFDGPREYHDFFRVTSNNKGTYDIVKPVIEKLAKIKLARFGTTAVLCRGMDPQKVFDEASKTGVKNIEMVPVVSTEESFYPDLHDFDAYRKFINNYSGLLAGCHDLESIPVLTRFFKILCRVMGYNNSRVPCGAGRNFFGIGPDGILYPCFRFIGIKDYNLGNVFSGLDLKAIQRFTDNGGRTYENRLSCKECWAAPLCGGPCYSCSELFEHRNGEPIRLHCAYIREDAYNAIRLFNYLRTKNSARLYLLLQKSLNA